MPANTNATPPLPRSREVRLGLVMYGGVSLAIYINGVAHELFRAVRGRGVYRLVKALTDSDVVVDVLSGSSAGGINGILLSYALCNQCEFSSTAELWRENGDIDALLRPTDDPTESYQSLLNSEGRYEPSLRKAFDDMQRNPIRQGADVAASALTELDLFVTGTDFYGRIWKTADDRGNVVDVKDHRALFWLKHRAGRKEPFNAQSNGHDIPANAPANASTTHAALARLARITSCFPAAFTPVRVRPRGGVDQRLRFWGRVTSPSDRVYIDGGVLDNKPFSSTLEAIYSRTASHDVERWLLYVEPDPERFAEPQEVPQPSIVHTAVQSLTALPAYESIADDLRVIRKHNERARNINALREQLMHSAEHVGDEAAYARIRLIGLRDHVFAAFFKREVGEGEREVAIDRAQVALRDWYDEQYLGSEPKAAIDPIFALDVDFHLRRILHVVYNCQTELRAVSSLLDVVNRQVQALEIIRRAMEAAVEEVAAARLKAENSAVPHADASAADFAAWAEGVWLEVFGRLQQVASVRLPVSYTVPRGPSAECLSSAELKQLSLDLHPLVRGPDDNAGFFRASECFERGLFSTHASVQDAYARFQAVDAATHPLEVLTGMCGYDVLKIARISPLDAKNEFSIDGLAKVTGQRYGHFAAFFKKSWRANDIMWGRLDSAYELIDILVDAKRVRAVFDQDLTVDAGVLTELRAATELLRQTLEPKLDPSAHAKLFAWLRELGSADRARRQLALAQLSDTRDNPKEWLRFAAQREVLDEGLRDVFEDAADEQLSWNHYPNAAADGGKVRFTPGNSVFDPAIASAASAKIAAQAFEDLARDPVKLGAYFSDDYKVGSETIEHVPRLVVADWVTHALIVAQKCLLVAAGPRGDVIRSQPLYQLTLGWPLRAGAGVINLLRKSPSYTNAFALSALTYIALSIFVFARWRESVLEGPVGTGLIIVVPLFLTVMLRFAVLSKDGSGAITFLVRTVGWAIGIVFAAALAAALAFSDNAAAVAACQKLGGYCDANAVAAVRDFGRALSWAAMFMGVVASTGMFGALTRRFRKWERKRLAGVSSSRSSAAPQPQGGQYGGSRGLPVRVTPPVAANDQADRQRPTGTD